MNSIQRNVIGRILPVLLFLLLLMARGAASRIGLMGATDEEIAFLKKEMKIEKTETVGGREFYVGTCQGQEVALVRSRIGKVNAAVTTLILIRDFDADRIIFTGVAGAVDAALEPGDIVISTQLVQHDYGFVSDDAFTPWPLKIPKCDDDFRGHDPELRSEFRSCPRNSERVFERFNADPKLAALAFDAGLKTNFQEIRLSVVKPDKRKPKVIQGIIATGDQFIASVKKRDWLRAQFNAAAVEMEGAALAQVCATYNIPFVVIRSISDRADGTAGATYALMKDAAAINSGMLVENMLKMMGEKAGK